MNYNFSVIIKRDLFKRRALLSFLLFFALIFVVSCSPGNEEEESDSPLTKWELWNNGTKLRGVNIWQKKIDREVDENFIGPGEFGPPFTQEDFNRISSLGVNYINISHPGIFNVDPPYVLNEGALANLKGLIDMIGKADMFAVISFRTGPGRSEYTFYLGEDYQSDPENGWFDEKYYNDRVWESPDAQSAWGDMWKRAAEEFKDNPYVVGYDLMVEPNSSDIFFDIMKPEEFYDKYAGTTYDWNQFFPNIISSIRTVDLNTPLIVGAMFYSELEWLPYVYIVSDEKTIYSFHQYSPHLYTHQSINDGLSYPGNFDIDWDEVPDNFDKNWLENYLNILENFINNKGKVSAANEYGAVRYAPGLPGFLEDEMNIFENLGINYAIWAFSSSYEPYRSEIDDFDFMMGTDPANKTDLPDNPLLRVLKKYWSKNNLRPSNTAF